MYEQESSDRITIATNIQGSVHRLAVSQSPHPPPAHGLDIQGGEYTSLLDNLQNTSGFREHSIVSKLIQTLLKYTIYRLQS